MRGAASEAASTAAGGVLTLYTSGVPILTPIQLETLLASMIYSTEVSIGKDFGALKGPSWNREVALLLSSRSLSQIRHHKGFTY